jgi:hypothetical protein
VSWRVRDPLLLGAHVLWPRHSILLLNPAVLTFPTPLRVFQNATSPVNATDNNSTSASNQSEPIRVQVEVEESSAPPGDDEAGATDSEDASSSTQGDGAEDTTGAKETDDEL